jgi:hypothetical protein
VGFDAILNTAWVLLGFAALVAMLCRALQGRSPALCCIGVGLIIAALFPVISATDDVIRIQHLDESHRHGSDTNSHKRTNDSLIRLYEAMESPLAVTPIRIAFSLCFVFLIMPLCEAYARLRTIAQSGRSPPFCLG